MRTRLAGGRVWVDNSTPEILSSVSSFFMGLCCSRCCLGRYVPSSSLRAGRSKDTTRPESARNGVVSPARRTYVTQSAGCFCTSPLLLRFPSPLWLRVLCVLSAPSFLEQMTRFLTNTQTTRVHCLVFSMQLCLPFHGKRLFVRGFAESFLFLCLLSAHKWAISTPLGRIGRTGACGACVKPGTLYLGFDSPCWCSRARGVVVLRLSARGVSLCVITYE